MDDHVSAGAQNISGLAGDDYSQVPLGAYNSSQIFADLLGVRINSSHNLNLGLLQHQAHDSRANGPNSVLDHANFMSGQKGLQPRAREPGKKLILHDDWRRFSDERHQFQASP